MKIWVDVFSNWHTSPWANQVGELLSTNTLFRTPLRDRHVAHLHRSWVTGLLWHQANCQVHPFSTTLYTTLYTTGVTLAICNLHFLDVSATGFASTPSHGSGIISTACFLLMPKKLWSKQSAPSRKEPCLWDGGMESNYWTKCHPHQRGKGIVGGLHTERNPTKCKNKCRRFI